MSADRHRIPSVKLNPLIEHHRLCGFTLKEAHRLAREQYIKEVICPRFVPGGGRSVTQIEDRAKEVPAQRTEERVDGSEDKEEEKKAKKEKKDKKAQIRKRRTTKPQKEQGARAGKEPEQVDRKDDASAGARSTSRRKTKPQKEEHEQAEAVDAATAAASSAGPAATAPPPPSKALVAPLRSTQSNVFWGMHGLKKRKKELQVAPVDWSKRLAEPPQVAPVDAEPPQVAPVDWSKRLAEPPQGNAEIEDDDAEPPVKLPKTPLKIDLDEEEELQESEVINLESQVVQNKTEEPTMPSTRDILGDTPGPDVIEEQLEALMDKEMGAGAEFLPSFEDEFGWLFDNVPEARGTALDMLGNEPKAVLYLLLQLLLVGVVRGAFVQRIQDSI